MIDTKDTLFQMYGTSQYMITRDARIFSVAENRFVVDPWRIRIDPSRPLRFKDDQFDITLTLPQFVMYTFYGRAKSKIALRYPDDVPTVENCFYMERPRFHEDTGMDVVYCAGEEFRKCGYEHRHNINTYINSMGAIISHTVISDIDFFNFVPWKYINSYPYGGTFGVGMPIHLIVWRVWGPDEHSTSRKSDIHHQNGCRWDARIENLESLSRRDHSRLHFDDSMSHGRTYSEDEIRTVMKMIEDDAHVDDIVDYLSEGKSDRHNAARLVFQRILDGKAYPEIAKDYDFSKYQRFKGIRYDEDRIREVCEMLMSKDPAYSDLAIASKVGIPPALVREIRIGKPKNAVARKVIEEYKGLIDPSVRADGKYRPVLTDDNVLEILKLCVRTNLTNAEIASKFGCSSETVRLIRNGKNPTYLHINSAPIQCLFSLNDIKYRKGILEIDENDPRVISIINNRTHT